MISIILFALRQSPARVSTIHSHQEEINYYGIGYQTILWAPRRLVADGRAVNAEKMPVVSGRIAWVVVMGVVGCIPQHFLCFWYKPKRFRPRAAPLLKRGGWHSPPRSKKEKEGGAGFVFTASSMEAIARQIPVLKSCRPEIPQLACC